MPKKRILIVEDDRLVIKAIERYLLAEGYSVCWSETARGGLKLLDSEKIDLVILDIVLDGPSGHDFLREKLMNPAHAAIPVLIISGMAAPEIRSGARVMKDPLEQAIAILGKPPNMKEVLAWIEKKIGPGKDRPS